MRVVSRAVGRFETSEVVVRRGNALRAGPCATGQVATGTRLAVTDLWGALPVRQRHAPSSPANRMEGVRAAVVSMALAHPAVAMTLVDAAARRQVLSVDGGRTLTQTLSFLFGERADQAEAFEVAVPPSLVVSGYALVPPQGSEGASGGGHLSQLVVVNGRPVLAEQAAGAVQAAFRAVVEAMARRGQADADWVSRRASFVLRVTCPREWCDLSFDGGVTRALFPRWETSPVRTALRQGLVRAWRRAAPLAMVDEVGGGGAGSADARGPGAAGGEEGGGGETLLEWFRAEVGCPGGAAPAGLERAAGGGGGEGAPRARRSMRPSAIADRAILRGGGPGDEPRGSGHRVGGPWTGAQSRAVDVSVWAAEAPGARDEGYRAVRGAPPPVNGRPGGAGSGQEAGRLPSGTPRGVPEGAEVPDWAAEGLLAGGPGEGANEVAEEMLAGDAGAASADDGPEATVVPLASLLRQWDQAPGGRGAGQPRVMTLADLERAAARGPLAAPPPGVRPDHVRTALPLDPVDAKFLPAVSAPAGGGPAELLLVFDQHAADERVRLEELRDEHLAPPGPRPRPSVALAQPSRCALSPAEDAALERFAGAVVDWGWRWEERAGVGAGPPGGGDRIVWVTAVPSVAGTPLSVTDLRVFLARLDESAGACGAPPAVHRALASKACRSAIMFGDALTRGQAGTLLRCLGETRQMMICAHGRPTVAPLASVPAVRRAQRALGERAGGPGGMGTGGEGAGDEGERKRYRAEDVARTLRARINGAGAGAGAGSEGAR